MKWSKNENLSRNNYQLRENGVREKKKSMIQGFYWSRQSRSTTKVALKVKANKKISIVYMFYVLFIIVMSMWNPLK